MKYNKVYYYDKDGIRKEFFSKDLDNKEHISALKQYEIWDDTELIALTPTDFVDHQTRISFFRAKPNQPNRLIGNEESERHDLKISNMIKIINNSYNLKVWYKDFREYPCKDIVLFNLQDYHWNFEVTREVAPNCYGRFDLYGVCSKGTLSKKRPEIIIEVIDSHFLDKDLFNFLRQRSINFSCYILFYFLDNENIYNKLQQDDLRISAFMKDGKFYFGGIMIKEYEPAIQDEIENPYLYYNQINQYIIKVIRKGQKVDLSKLKKENLS